MADREYRRLTRAKSRSLFGVVSTARSSLWLGKDHLLQIDASGYSESYKRFYFRDIQALVFCRTDAWLYRSVVFVALASLFALIAIFGGGPVLGWIFGVIAGLFGLFVLLELLAGPSAKAYLRTAVQTEALISLSRLRRARYVSEMLHPLIIAAQGEFGGGQHPAADSLSGLPPVITSGRDLSSGSATEASNPPTAGST
jgi:hypothetical protein